ncbi:MAG: hypothetical protein DWQ31_05115 [Planctomycetota bacterium]|nr:MAG: hypothetical protein DWQ31_05115 [Planctomycetota bacterium]REJ90061.1 MAG: hypothetical protein DWQ35_17010 [Planctomycetota bacterium]REK23141.1 MAG: hypothetical protein DWQ42_15615 [Planctomycetota bacterium]REK43416.1 MAG: hypothetical protein DWQ46_11460 [Planctomycetota bacterium]
MPELVELIEATFPDVLVTVAMVFVLVGPLAWAIGDAQRRGESGGSVAIWFLFTGPLVAVFWLMLRPPQTALARRPAETDNAEEALSVAASLDQDGEWDAAARWYREVARRWPERSAYVSACLAEIREKRSLAREA